MVPMAPAFLLYVEEHKRLGTLKFRSEVPDSHTFTVAAEVLALSIAVGDCTTIVQSRSKLSGVFIVIVTAFLKGQLDHENPGLLVRVIDVDEPGTGRIPRTLLKHRSGMKAGGITPSDLRDVGLSLMFVHRMDEVLDSSAQAVVKLEVFSAYVDYTVQCRRTEMDATGLVAGGR
jgi:hypothetical protein